MNRKKIFLSEKIKIICSNQYSQEIFLNFLSMFFLACGGFFFTLIIMVLYNPQTLGIFNTTYAYYIIFSQVAVMGIHMSVLQMVSTKREEKDKCDCIVSSAVVMTLAISVLTVLILYFLLNIIGTEVFDIEQIKAFHLALPALVLFAINKVLFNYFNAMLKLKFFAILQGVRNIFITISIISLALLRVEGFFLNASFLFAEILLFVIEVIYILRKNKICFRVDTIICKKILKFGLKIFPGNMVTEFNTKVDIICLGLILKDNVVIGIYSFAILFAEGFYQMFIVIRRFVNPMISDKYNQGILNEYIKKVSSNVAVNIMAGGGGIAVVLGYWLICILAKGNQYIYGVLPLSIVVLSIVICRKTIIFANIFSQLNYPIWESVINIVSVVSNFLLNIVAIYFWGMAGAGIATAISYVVFMLLLKNYTRKKMQIQW